MSTCAGPREPSANAPRPIAWPDQGRVLTTARAATGRKSARASTRKSAGRNWIDGGRSECDTKTMRVVAALHSSSEAGSPTSLADDASVECIACTRFPAGAREQRERGLGGEGSQSQNSELAARADEGLRASEKRGVRVRGWRGETSVSLFGTDHCSRRCVHCTQQRLGSSYCRQMTMKLRR